jgi:hypothetical protein
MARPTKLTPEVHARVVKAIRAANYFKPAAEAAGISEATFHRWMKEGKKAARGKYHDFHEAVKQAQAEVEVELAARILKAAGEDWRAALTLLERRHSERWGRRSSHEHTGAGGAPLRLGEVIFDDPEARKAARKLLDAAGAARARESGGAGAGE